MDKAGKSTPYINIYISSATTVEDKKLLNKLEKQLSMLKREGNIRTWNKSLIVPGTDWQREITTQISQADLILLLISPDFMASDECHTEMKLAVRRMKAGEAHVIPILMRPTADWRASDIGNLQPLPADQEPISSRTNHDKALKGIVEDIRPIIEQMHLSPSNSHPLYDSPMQPSPYSPRAQSSNLFTESSFTPLPAKTRRGIRLSTTIIIAIMVIIIVSGALVIPGLLHRITTSNEPPGNTPSSITPTTIVNTTDPAASSIIINVQTASAIDATKRPTTLATSFQTYTNIFTTFQLNLNSVDVSPQHPGYVQAKYYRDGKSFNTTDVIPIDSHTISNDSFPPFEYYYATADGAVKVFWCRVKDCSDAKLAQTASFTVS